MTYDLFKEEPPFPRQEENEPEEDSNDAQAFQTKGGHFLRNQSKGPFTSSAPPNNMVPPNQSTDNNPPPPKGPPDFHNKGNSPSVSKGNASYNVEFDIVSEMQKKKTSLSYFDILKWCPAQREIVLEALEQADKSKGKNKMAPATNMNAALYRRKVGTPFLLSLRICGKNLHNFMLDSRASGNVMPFSIYKKLGLNPVQTNKKVIQLDKTEVNVVGELRNIHVQVGSDPRIQTNIDIQVADISKTYGMLLSRDLMKGISGISPLTFHICGYHGEELLYRLGLKVSPASSMSSLNIIAPMR